MKTKKMKIEAVRHKSKQDYQFHRLLRNHYADTHGPLLEVARSMFEILEGRGCQDEAAWARKIKDAENVEVSV